MHAWILDESPGEYRFGELPDPVPGYDDVRVRPVASALNHMDLWLTKGLPRPPLPHVPGCDIAGVVDQVGDGVEGVAVGDQVVVNPSVSPADAALRLGHDSPLAPGFSIVGEHRWGGHAELVVVPARNVVPRPLQVPWEECAAYPTALSTAWRMLRRARVRPGDVMLIVGFGGGVSTAAFALGMRMGAHVYVTSRQMAKREHATNMGAVDAFDTESDWPVKADVVVESVGPATWDRSIGALNPGGRLVVCGGTSGQKVELNLPRLFFKQIEIIGSSMSSYPEFAEVAEMVDQGMPAVVDDIMPLSEYPRALERLRSEGQLGKIVLRHHKRV